MKLNVKIEFDIEGEEFPSDEDIKEMVYNYLAEAIELEELDYSIEAADEDILN
jgi:hypothetical protein